MKISFLVFCLMLTGFALTVMLLDRYLGDNPSALLCDWHLVGRLELLGDQWTHVPFTPVQADEYIRYRYDEELGAVLIERCLPTWY